MTARALDTTVRPSPRPSPRPTSRARPFLDGTACCYCDLPVFTGHGPQNRGLGAWSHAGCRRGRPRTRLAVPLATEVRAFVLRTSGGGATPADLDAEAEAWLYSFWLRACPHWPAVLVRSGSSGQVGALLDEIEDAFDACLWGDGVPVSSSGEDLERAFLAAAERFACFAPAAMAAPVLGSAAFDDWLRQGHRLDFVVWAD